MIPAKPILSTAQSERGTVSPTVLPASPRCPFHDGAATLDLLLAELDPRETELFDAALDLRAEFAAGADAATCAAQLLRVRALLGERHYLAFYRVRCWARRALHIEVRGT